MTTTSNYPGGFPNGLTVRNVPVLESHAGNVFWVDSGIGSDTGAAKGTFARPFATVDYAIGRCTASNGDIIIMAPGHAETISAASGITADIAGVAIVAARNAVGTLAPTFTFSATASTWVISAANVTVQGVRLVPSIDSVVTGFSVSGTDCWLDYEVLETDDAIEFVRSCLTTAAADRLTVNVRKMGRTGGNACVNEVRLVGCNGGRINVDFYGVASTAVVEFLTTACTDIEVTGYVYNSGTTDGSKLVVDTATSSTWFATIKDGAAGATYSGGSGAALAADDVSSIAATLLVPAGDATSNVDVSDVVGNKTDAAIQAVTTTKSLMAYVKGNNDALAGAAGVATFPASAAPANGVSLAEVIRAIYDRQIGNATTASANSLLGTRVSRTTADVITGAAVPIFTVATGRVLLTCLTGKVTTIIGAGATNAKFQFNPTTGTTNDICANLDIDADEAGALYSISGVASDAMLRSESGAIRNMSANGVILDVGDIEFVTAADRSGSISFIAYYIPLEDGATLAAA